MADRPKKPESKQQETKAEAKKPKTRKPEAKEPRPVIPVMGEGLARRDPEALFPRTEAEWSLYLDDVVDGANRGLRRMGTEGEAVADGLFRATCVREVKAGLDPLKHGTEAFMRLSQRAGASLALTVPELVNYVRVGAMNQHRDDGAWLDLHWSKKLLLVELLDLEDGMEKLKEGIQYAGQPNVGVRHLRVWIYALKPRKPKNGGRPRNEGLTLTAGGKFAETGVQLKSKRQRTAFVKQLRKAPPEKRRRLEKDLREALKGLQALVDELQDVDGSDDE